MMIMTLIKIELETFWYQKYEQREYNVVYWYLVLQTEIIIKFEIPAASSTSNSELKCLLWNSNIELSFSV